MASNTHWYVTVHECHISFIRNDIVDIASLLLLIHSDIPYPAVMVMFVQTPVHVNEGNSGSVCVTITGQLERSVAINVSIAGGSAMGSDHDFPASTVLTFSSSPDIKCIFFDTTQNGIYESDETLLIRLDSFDPQVKTGADAVYKIIDSDDGMYISWVEIYYKFVEHLPSCTHSCIYDMYVAASKVCSCHIYEIGTL